MSFTSTLLIVVESASVVFKTERVECACVILLLLLSDCVNFEYDGPGTCFGGRSVLLDNCVEIRPYPLFVVLVMFPTSVGNGGTVTGVKTTSVFVMMSVMEKVRLWCICKSGCEGTSIVTTFERKRSRGGGRRNCDW